MIRLHDFHGFDLHAIMGYYRDSPFLPGATAMLQKSATHERSIERFRPAAAKSRSMFEERRRHAFEEAGQLDRMSFAKKIELARSQGILLESDARLTHGLREIRNIVHPRAELRGGILLTKHHVEMARSFLKVMLKRMR